LKEAKFPDSLTEIRPYAFHGCIGLQSVELSGCQKIGSLAFADCPSLKTVILPKTGLKTVAGTSFRPYLNLKKLTYPGTLKEAYQTGTLEALRNLSEFILACTDREIKLSELF
jgi:hypothetical protein